MNFTVTKFLASVLVIMLHQSVGQQWVEKVDENGQPLDMDMYFDRVVMISYNDERIICTGVLIDNKRVLTSFNPFRQYFKKNLMGKLVIIILGTRERIGKTNTFDSRGVYFRNTIICYKKVQPIEDNQLTSEQWHGFKREHSPVHDLLIIQFDVVGVQLLDPNPKLYSFDKIYSKTVVGPMITILAKRNDTLGSGMKFASLGYRDVRHVRARLRTYEYPYGSNAEVDCDEWIIRDWGRFICLKNKENYLGIQAGALLIHNEKLYGIGCFTLKKGNESIYVFTDIREYRKEIFNTCGKPPANGTDLYKYQHDPSENMTRMTTPSPNLHLGRRYHDDWF